VFFPDLVAKNMETSPKVINRGEIPAIYGKFKDVDGLLTFESTPCDQSGR